MNELNPEYIHEIVFVARIKYYDKEETANKAGLATITAQLVGKNVLRVHEVELLEDHV